MAKQFDFDWEAGGIIDWIGRGYGTGTWRNPQEARDVKVTASSVRNGHLNDLVDKEPHGKHRLRTDEQRYSWVQVDLPVAVRATHYRLSHPGPQSGFLRNWAFCGSFDGVDWRILCQHTNDETLNDQDLPVSLTGAWELRVPEGEYYPHFRLVSLDKGSSQAVSASCLELFGSVRHRVWPSNLARGLNIAPGA
eukprot:Hpha_TRINITY_DN5591_c0_g1::TRINITY_DN5591_c0_g1_i1::g.93690::m.93690